jgi:PPOX class probable F420-dependent enzyme
MIDLTSELGTRALQRIREDFFLWLTTIDAKGFPQPRPVWFTWDGEAFLVYSQPGARKLQHIKNNPNVALHFDGGLKGLDVQVILATAEVINDPIPANQIGAYLRKYGDEIRKMGATEEEYFREFSVAIRIQPKRLRGMTISA